jgi:hypothetical protein
MVTDGNKERQKRTCLHRLDKVSVKHQTNKIYNWLLCIMNLRKVDKSKDRSKNLSKRKQKSLATDLLYLLSVEKHINQNKY